LTDPLLREADLKEREGGEEEYRARGGDGKRERKTSD
jgi:hypothetical protein